MHFVRHLRNILRFLARWNKIWHYWKNSTVRNSACHRNWGTVNDIVNVRPGDKTKNWWCDRYVLTWSCWRRSRLQGFSHSQLDWRHHQPAGSGYDQRDANDVQVAHQRNSDLAGLSSRWLDDINSAISLIQLYPVILALSIAVSCFGLLAEKIQLCVIGVTKKDVLTLWLPSAGVPDINYL